MITTIALLASPFHISPPFVPIPCLGFQCLSLFFLFMLSDATNPASAYIFSVSFRCYSPSVFFTLFCLFPYMSYLYFHLFFPPLSSTFSGTTNSASCFHLFRSLFLPYSAFTSISFSFFLSCFQALRILPVFSSLSPLFHHILRHLEVSLPHLKGIKTHDHAVL